MNLSAFEGASGLSVHWLHWMSLMFAGVVLLIVSVALLANLLYHVAEGNSKGAIGLMIWVFVLVSMTLVMFGIILSM